MELQLKDRWKEHEQHFVTGVGKRKAIIQNDINYYDYDYVEYNPTDLTIKPVPFDEEGNPIIEPEFAEYEYYVRANRFKAFFNKAIDGVKLASFHFDNADGEGRYVNYCPVGIKPTSEVIEGNQITYVDAFPDIDIRYTVGTRILKMDIIYKCRQAVREIIVQSELSEGLEIWEMSDGRLGFHDIETDEILFETTTLNAWDSADEPNTSEAFHYQLNIDGTITLKIDAWLWFDTAEYPVTLDPTTELQPDDTTGKDVRIYSSLPDNNDGALDTLTVGYYGRYYSLIEFNVLDISGSVISAKMSLNNWRADVNGINVHLITSVWDEFTVTWNTQPTIDATAILNIPSFSLGWNDFDITDTVQDWIDTPSNNKGIMLKPTVSTSAQLRFYSSDYVADTSIRPKLTIEYTEGGGGEPQLAHIFGTINKLGRGLIQ